MTVQVRWGSRGKFIGWRFASTVGALAGVSIAVACSAFDGLTVVKKAPESTTECQPAKPVKAPGGQALVFNYLDFTVAVKSVDFGEPLSDGGVPDFRKVGFDLDNACTGIGKQGPTCRKPSWASTIVDGPGGRDNAYANFFEAEDGGALAPNTNKAAETGAITALYTIHWTGYPNDSDVHVSFYAASGCVLDGLLPRCPGADGGLPLFRWDGTDVWTPFVEWVTPTGPGADGGMLYAPIYKSDNAYVSQVREQYYLVAHFKTVRGAINIPYSDFWLQARIDPNEVDLTRRTLILRDGVAAGRANADAVIGNLEFYNQPGTQKPLCVNSPQYADVKRRICRYIDISFVGNDAGAPCDAISWAWKFEAFPAHLGPGVFPVTEDLLRSKRCSPELSPRNDRCGSDAGAP